MAGNIDQRTIGVPAAVHQGCQGPLPAPAQQRASQPGRVEISSRLHRNVQPSYCKKGLFSGLEGGIWGLRIVRRSVFAELGHTSAQLALLVDRVRSPLM